MRILILGGAGMLGHKLWQKLPLRFKDTWVTLRKRKPDYSKLSLFDHPHVIDGLDVSDFDSLKNVLNEVRPNILINCIAITKRQKNAENFIDCISLNSLLPHQLAQWAEGNQAKVIHFSTDCVFDGKLGEYTEDSKPCAEDLYGQTKALGEIKGKNSLTLRSSFIGRELSSGTELIEWFLKQKGKTIHGFRQALYTGLTTLATADLVGDLIEKNPELTGLYQIASETINKYDLLLLLQKAFKLDVVIHPDDQFVCKRNLNGSYFKKITGYVSPSWQQMIADLANDPTPYPQWKRENDL